MHFLAKTELGLTWDPKFQKILLENGVQIQRVNEAYKRKKNTNLIRKLYKSKKPKSGSYKKRTKIPKDCVAEKIDCLLIVEMARLKNLMKKLSTMKRKH